MDPKKKKKKKVSFPDRQKKTTKSGFTYLLDTGQPLHTGHNIPKPGKKTEKEFLRSQGGIDKREVQIPGYHETHAAVGEEIAPRVRRRHLSIPHRSRRRSLRTHLHRRPLHTNRRLRPSTCAMVCRRRRRAARRTCRRRSPRRTRRSCPSRFPRQPSVSTI